MVVVAWYAREKKYRCVDEPLTINHKLKPQCCKDAGTVIFFRDSDADSDEWERGYAGWYIFASDARDFSFKRLNFCCFCGKELDVPNVDALKK